MAGHGWIVVGTVGSHPSHKKFGWFLIWGSVGLHCPKPTRSSRAENNSRQKKLEFCPAQVRFGGEEPGGRRRGCVSLAAGTARYTNRGDGRRQLPVWLPLLIPIPPLEELRRGTVGAGRASAQPNPAWKSLESSRNSFLSSAEQPDSHNFGSGQNCAQSRWSSLLTFW